MGDGPNYAAFHNGLRYREVLSGSPVAPGLRSCPANTQAESNGLPPFFCPSSFCPQFPRLKG